MGWGGAGPSGTAFGDTALLVRIAVVTGRRVEGLGEPVTGRRVGTPSGIGVGPWSRTGALRSSPRRASPAGPASGARGGPPATASSTGLRDRAPGAARPSRRPRGDLRGSRAGPGRSWPGVPHRAGGPGGGPGPAGRLRRGRARARRGWQAVGGRGPRPRRSSRGPARKSTAGPPRSRFPRPEAVDCVTVLRPPLCCRTRPRAADSLTAINPGPPTGLRVARRQVSGRAPATRAPVGLTPAHPGRSARSGGL